MNFTKSKIQYYITKLLFLFFFSIPVHAQKEAETFNVDTVLYAYYQRCQENLQKPIVLKMSDTLYNIAEEKNDKRMQAVALSTKLDYFYYKADQEDSIIYYTNKVKEFSRKTNQSKYFYFAWGNRLILFYLKTNRANIALYEAEKMLKEAQKENDKTGLLSCYKSMSNVYSSKGFKKLSFEWSLKEIELTESQKIENYNISTTFCKVADYYIEVNKKAEAFEALKKAERTANSLTQKANARLFLAKYYLTYGNITEAAKILKECAEMFLKDKRLDAQSKNFYGIETIYYTKIKQYQKALESALKQEEAINSQNEYTSLSINWRTKADIYFNMGEMEQAYKELLKSVELSDSIRIDNEQRASSEFATLLNVEKLSSEKKELMLQSQQKELHNKTLFIILLTILLGAVFIFLYRENLLNRKLRASETDLKISNEELTDSREELRIAKEKAENASQMKTTFIQSMSHEIRTPLNSIVGFSQILSDNYGQNPETKEFVEIIKTNTNDLLRLVTDVLTLSELDQYEKLPAEEETDINMCCQPSIEIGKATKKENVALHFHPARETLIIRSNPARISQLLINLVHNAAKFTDEGHITLEYTVSEADKTIRFQVTDTGKGIPDDKQNLIFERFFKTDSFTQGTGLGLPICESIAEKLGGKLYLDKTYKDGCRFIFTLPYTDFV